MKKNILFSKEARDKVKSGANLIADAVCITLGPMGRTVLISESILHDYEFKSFPIRATKDGVSVARSIKSEDPVENVGVLLLREASEKTMMQCGDGTTSTVVLARAIINAGLELVEAGANPMELKKGIDWAVDKVVEYLKEMAIPIGEGIENIRHIATIAANNDTVIGDLVAEAFEKVGKLGTVDIEEAKSVKTEVKVSEGFKFDNGWISPLFITNHAKNESELNDPYILLYDKGISTIKQINNIVNQVASEKRPILFICDDMDGEALAFLTVNKSRGNLSSCVVKSPFVGEYKRQLMEDLAAVTGATFISDLKGIGIENVQLDHLGKAKKVIISKDSTVVVSGHKDLNSYDTLLNGLESLLVAAETEEIKEPIANRITRLKGRVAVISVGAATEVEMREKKDRVDDSIRAVKSAVSEGFAPGGGTVFLKIQMKDDLIFTDKQKGINLIADILREPMVQICENAGVNGEVKIADVLKSPDQNVGYNAKEDRIEDLIKAGVIDPVKVLRCSLQNAASIAGTVLTAEAMIVDSLN